MKFFSIRFFSSQRKIYEKNKQRWLFFKKYVGEGAVRALHTGAHSVMFFNTETSLKM